MEKELNGYKNKDEVPEYRIFTPLNLGQFQGYGGAEIKNAPLPLAFMPDYVKEDYSLHYAAHGVHFYEDHFSDANQTELVYAWDADVIALLQQEHSLYPDFVIVSAKAKVARSNFAGIFDAVRNRLLELALELQKNYPDSDESLGKLPNDGISSIVHMTVYGGQQNIASGNQVTQTPTQHIHANNFEELRNTLQGLGVADEEIEQLKVAIELDKPIGQKGQLGTDVRRWLGDVSANAMGSATTAVVVQNWSQITSAIDRFVKYFG